jgi:ABC-type multidrug transport system permease subunit
LYQVQERPSKTYAWPAFLIAQILAEIPYQIFLGILIFAIWHYTVLGVQTAEQEGLILLFFVALLLWAGTLAQLVISAVPNSEAAAMLATVMFSLSLLFSGVLQPPSGMPQFWKFLWRVSPLTYWIGGIASTGLHGRTVKCAVEELSTFNPPRGLTCDAYMQSYLQLAPGHLINPNATADCQYCSLSQVDQYLAQMDIYWSERWRNFGIFTVYICFNVVMTIVLYYFFASGKFRGSLRRVRRVLTPFRTK